MAESDEELDNEHGVSVIITVDEMLTIGLEVIGFTEEMQAKTPKSNRGTFHDRYGSSPEVLATVWEDLQTTAIDAARVPPKKLILRYFLMAHHFIFQYPTETERYCDYKQRKATQRDWVWYFLRRIAALLEQKIVWPSSHIDGDDIWVATVDGTMSAANEKAGKDVVKDPARYSFKHHAAGFNTEVAVSIKESRCIWIRGPYEAGTYSDRVIFREPNGLKEKLKQCKKKAIADGGYSGDPSELSTPNGHDSASVRKFKSRALKRHEKFNSMLKVFNCLAVKARHEDDGYKICFHAVAVICQYQLENGSPLWNIYVGDM